MLFNAAHHGRRTFFLQHYYVCTKTVVASVMIADCGYHRETRRPLIWGLDALKPVAAGWALWLDRPARPLVVTGHCLLTYTTHT